jgi:hypothetical protein
VGRKPGAKPRADGQEPDTRRCRAGRAGKRLRSSYDRVLRRRKSGGCAGKERVLTRGDLGLTPERAAPQGVLEESAEVVVAGPYGSEGPKEREGKHCGSWRRTTQMFPEREARHCGGSEVTVAGVSQQSEPRGWCEVTRLVASTASTARCGPACRVVWEGSGPSGPAPIPIVRTKNSGSRQEGCAPALRVLRP